MLKLGLSSNVAYTYDPAKPYGQRITSVTVDGRPLDAQRKYTVGSVTFLLAGGDSFDALTAGGAPAITDNLDRERFNAYLGSHPGLKPRAAKSSIGVTLPSAPVADGQTIDIPLRGLSFSEGPSVTKNVNVSVGSTSTTAAVDNSLIDANANNEKAVVTGKNVTLPVTVATDFAEVVGAGQGLTVTVACAGAGQPSATPSAPSTSADPVKPSTGIAAPTATGAAKPPTAQTVRSAAATGGRGRGLAHTGPAGMPLIAAALILLLLGGGLVARAKPAKPRAE